ncbi:MAG: phosphoribosyltransferase family protein, partial [Gammaproteobacteria bacterium]|nr:phosphoribosyltransferase family protein [Gammaproteobacteria bacterium]
MIPRVHDDPALRDRAPVFADRAAAGRHLAQMLDSFRDSGALAAAIPAGGVPVAAEIASALELDLVVLPVSKILFPWTTESGFGAVAFDGSAWVNEATVAEFGLAPEEVARCTDDARAKVECRLERFHGESAPELEERTIILVDDGVAAGSTLRAAIAALRRQKAARIIVAVPTGHARSLKEVAGIADETFCANARGGPRFAVADAYQRWHDL